MNQLASELKRAIDQLRRTLIFHTRDEYGDVYVYEHRGRRLLTFDERFEQSSMNLAEPHKPEHRYIRAMLLPLAFERPRHCLHLGLGGGALVRAMAHLVPESRQTAVELRAGVRRVVQHYFLGPEQISPANTVRIVGDEASRFVQAAKPGSYDFISADLYLAAGMDARQGSHKFLVHCRQSLSPEGWLALNFTRLPDYREPLFTTLREHFGTVIVVSVDALNFVILAGVSRNHRPLMSYAPKVLALGQALGVNLLQQLKQASEAHSFFHDTE